MRSGTDLPEFLDAVPTAFHAVDAVARSLEAAGAKELREDEEWNVEPGVLHYFRRGGTSLVGFRAGFARPAERGFMVLGAHTDSPCLKLRPGKEIDEGGMVRAAVEVYGAPILSTWTDRPLELAGRVVIRGRNGPESRLVRTGRPVGVVPSLALHLNRDVNKGFEYNPHSHLPVLVEIPAAGKGRWLERLYRDAFGIDPGEVLAADLFFTEAGKAFRFGDSLLNGPRIDDLCACHALLESLLASAPAPHGQIAVFFDHEEVGSLTRTGANGSLLRDAVERLVCCGPSAPVGPIPGAVSTRMPSQDAWRAVARSFSISVDVAQAFHPAYSEKYDEDFAPRLNAGVAVKSGANMNYATTAETAAMFASIAGDAPLQTFMTKADIKPGSTIGPMSSALTGMPTVDVGEPILSMHASRETSGSRDHEIMIAALSSCLSAGPPR